MTLINKILAFEEGGRLTALAMIDAAANEAKKCFAQGNAVDVYTNCAHFVEPEEPEALKTQPSRGRARSEKRKTPKARQGKASFPRPHARVTSLVINAVSKAADVK